MSADRAWPLLAAVSGWYLLGLSVTVALVVYPAFARVGPDRWPAYHRLHSSAITRAVGPAWLVEGVATAGWLIDRLGWGWGWGWGGDGGGRLTVLALVHTAGAAATVGLTVAGAVPRHAALAAGFDRAAHGRLLVAHRWRTVAWTVAAVSATVALLD